MPETGEGFKNPRPAMRETSKRTHGVTSDDLLGLLRVCQRGAPVFGRVDGLDCASEAYRFVGLPALHAGDSVQLPGRQQT
jgi:hypothetical protein